VGKLDNFYVANKIPFSGNRGHLSQVTCASEAFKLFFDETIMGTIVQETNHYATDFVNFLKPRSRVHNWKNVDIDELYVLFAMHMLMGMIHKLTIKSYFSKNPLLDTPLFYKTMLQE
jgi:hypothetical protein